MTNTEAKKIVEPFYKKPDNRDKEAKWIISDDDFELPCCSECKCVAYENVYFSYCPNCGAKMEND